MILVVTNLFLMSRRVPQTFKTHSQRHPVSGEAFVDQQNACPTQKSKPRDVVYSGFWRGELYYSATRAVVILLWLIIFLYSSFFSC